MAAQLDRQASGNEIIGSVGRTRPFSDSGIAEFDVRERSLVSRVNRATTAVCL